MGIAKCAVTFGSTSIPVSWHIIDNPCEPVLAGQSAVQLGIISFDPQLEVYQPVRMIQSGNKEALQAILQKCPQNFEALGKLKNHQVKLHVDPTIKPVADDIKLMKFRPDNPEDKQECIQYSDVQWPEGIENEDDDQGYSFGNGDAALPLRRNQRKKTNVPVYISTMSLGQFSFNLFALGDDVYHCIYCVYVEQTGTMRDN